jgi:hypothetical protein
MERIMKIFEHADITILTLGPDEKFTNTSNEIRCYAVFLLHQVVELDPGEELTAAMLPFPEDRTNTNRLKV